MFTPDTTNAISSSGFLVEYEEDPTGAHGVFTPVAQVRDLTLPGFMRNEFDAVVHGKRIDQYGLGILRRNPFSFPINFLPKNGTHDASTGLYAKIIANEVFGMRFTFPDDDVTPTKWVLSGQVQAIQPAAPVDGLLTANVTVRFSGFMAINGVSIGS